LACFSASRQSQIVFVPDDHRADKVSLGIKSRRIELTHYPSLTLEQRKNIVPILFKQSEADVVRTILQDALALTSLTLFLAALAVWAQVLGVI
jgi:hypothetical protein